MTPEARLGYHLGQLVVAVGVVVAICVFAIKWYRARRRERERVEELARRYKLDASTGGRSERGPD